MRRRDICRTTIYRTTNNSLWSSSPPPRDDGRGVSLTAPTRPLGQITAPTRPPRRRRARRDVDRGRSAKYAGGPVHPSLHHNHHVDDLGSSGVSCIEALGRWDAPPGTSRRRRENTTTELGFSNATKHACCVTCESDNRSNICTIYNKRMYKLGYVRRNSDSVRAR